MISNTFVTRSVRGQDVSEHENLQCGGFLNCASRGIKAQDMDMNVMRDNMSER